MRTGRNSTNRWLEIRSNNAEDARRNSNVDDNSVDDDDIDGVDIDESPVVAANADEANFRFCQGQPRP